MEYYQKYCNCSEKAEKGNSSTCAYSKAPSTQASSRAETAYVHFVRDAAYVFAHALHNLWQVTCHSRPGLCPGFREAAYSHLKDFMKNVTFMDVAQFPFKFDNDSQDGPTRYSIISYSPDAAGEYDWREVGTYQDGKIYNLSTAFKQQHARQMAEKSRGLEACGRDTCGSDSIKTLQTWTHRGVVQFEDCCWKCSKCYSFEFRKSEMECARCERGQVQNNSSPTECQEAPVCYLSYSNPWAIGALCFAGVGLVMIGIAVVLLWRFWDTPVVRACGRELSCILIFGTFLSFCTTFIIVAKPTDFSCGVMRFLIGFCYTLCYAAVVTKTNRICRIFSAQDQGAPPCTSPAASVLICLSLTMVEVAINVIWLIVSPAKILYINRQTKKILVCSGVDQGFMAGLLFPFLLIVFATLYAFKTRKCPDGFNETRFILFTNCINTIHWLALVPLYLASTELEIRAVILAYSLSLSGIVQLSCLVLPKLYRALLRPEKNTTKEVMKHHGYIHPATPLKAVCPR